MKRWLRNLLLVAGTLILLLAAGLWWNRPRPVDMAAYAPADALIYLEANSLPDIFYGLASTEAWRTLAPVAGLKTDPTQISWFSRIAAWTGAGPSDVVVLSR